MNGYFNFLFWFSSAIFLSKIKSLSLNLYTSSLWVTSIFQVPITNGKCVLIYKLKDFRWWNFDTQFEFTGILISKVTILRSTYLINIYIFFWTCLSKILRLIRLIIIICSNYYRKIYEKLAKQFNIIPPNHPLVSANQDPTIMITRK